MAKTLSSTKVDHDELDALLGDRVPNNSYPYPSGSDLLELWLWQQRIELRIQETRPATEYEHWLYQPHELADKARASLSVKYPLIFKRVDELLDFARQADRDFVDGMASESDLFNAMGSLSDKIETAIKIVADDRDPQDGSPPKPALTQPPTERDDTKTETDEHTKSVQIDRLRRAISIVGTTAFPKDVMLQLTKDNPDGYGMNETTFRHGLDELRRLNEYCGQQRSSRKTP